MSARRIFDAITTWSGVEAWIEQHTEESLHLDFKQKASIKPDLDVDDRKNLAKALSGFANTEGGVLAFGIETAKVHGAPDHAIAIRPIPNVKQFKARVEDHISNLADPPVPADIRAIENDTGHGVVLVFIPQSDGGPHRAMGPGDVRDRYFMRVVSRTEPMPHTFLAAMFGRRPPPRLYLAIVVHLGRLISTADLWIGNSGRGYADRPAVGFIQDSDRNRPERNPAFWWHLFEPARGWDRVVVPAGGNQGVGCIVRADAMTVLYSGMEMPLGSIKTEKYVPDPFTLSLHGVLYAANGQPAKFQFNASLPLPERDLARVSERIEVPIVAGVE